MKSKFEEGRQSSGIEKKKSQWPLTTHQENLGNIREGGFNSEQHTDPRDFFF